MNKTKNLAVASMMALATMGVLFVPSTGASNNCSDSNRGAGTEPVSCDEISCLEGEHFLVDITASNNGDDVEAEGSCDTASSECESSHGQCATWSATPVTTASHGGSCSGSAEVGAHGSVDLYCESGSSHSEDMNPPIGLQELIESLGDCESILDALGDRTVQISFAKHMHWQAGLVTTTTINEGECDTGAYVLAPQDGTVHLKA